MALPTRTAAILVVLVGIFLLVAVTINYVAFTSKVYATGNGNYKHSSVPEMFSPGNIDCALHSGSCDLLQAQGP
jgi:hypothetical protein